MNNYTAIGRLGQDPEVKYFESGSSVATFTIAVDSGKDQTCWLFCEAWNKTGEMVTNHFKKGSQIGITGSLKQETWNDRTSGDKRSKIKVSVQRVSFCGKKNEGGERQSSRPAPHSREAALVESQRVGTPAGFEDDIPF